MIILILFFHPIISEVLNDAPGKEDTSGRRNEWIEVYNPGPDTIDFSRYGLTDFDERDTICAWTDSLILKFHPGVIFGNTKLPPFKFGVILDRNYTDTLNKDHPQPYKIYPGTFIFTIKDIDLGDNRYGLANTDPIAIFEIGSPNVYVSTFGINGVPFTSAHDGVSIERIILEKPDSLNNWAKSVDKDRSTPGRFNSVSPGFDLVIESAYVKPSFIKKGLNFRVYFYIKNIGSLDFSGNIHGFLKISNKVYFQFSGTIKSKDSVLQSVEMLENSEGVLDLQAKISPPIMEKDSFNNLINFKIVIDTPLLYITEIFYIGKPEWIEVKNPSRDTLFIDNLILRDLTDKNFYIKNLKIPGDTYAIFTSDTLQFYQIFGKIPFVFELSDFPSLNNDGDLVYITNSLKQRIDSVNYSPDWGGSYGVSLERYSFGPSWLKENWNSSQDPTGSTPGRGPYKIEMGEEKLKLSTQRFTPNNDGKDDILEIWVASSKEPSSLYLYDSAGFLKHIFFENQIINFPKLVRLSKNTISLKRGLYIVVLKQGNRIYKKTFVYFE
ncbi:MAG: hypothetical protein ABDH49_02940 [Candidatus Hydrothermales bacterium]